MTLYGAGSLSPGDVMRSDYRPVRRLAAKGWPVIPQSLKERFVKSGREEEEEEEEEERAAESGEEVGIREVCGGTQ